MDAVEKKIRYQRKRKYRALRKFRKARDIASKHLTENYTCNYLRKQIRSNNEVDWIETLMKGSLAIIIYEWCKDYREE